MNQKNDDILHFEPAEVVYSVALGRLRHVSVCPCPVLMVISRIYQYLSLAQVARKGGQTVYFGYIGEGARLSIISYAGACKCKTRTFVYLSSTTAEVSD